MRFLLSTVLLIVTLVNFASAQTITYEQDGLRLFISEDEDCGGLGSGPDPRWRARTRTQYTGFTNWNQNADDIGGGGWENFSNIGWIPPTTVPSDAVITVQLDAWEEDPFTCDNPCFFCTNGGPNDGSCGGYGTINTQPVTGQAPCVWHTEDGFRDCTDDDVTITWGVEYRYQWEYATVNAGSISGNQTLGCPGGNPGVISSTNGGTTAYTDYTWERQDNCTGSWVTISGATGATYNPPALSTTTCFRRRTNTCSAATAVTNTVTITVNPDATPPSWNNATLPSSQTLSATAGQCDAVATWSAPTATDNCSSVTVTQVAGPTSGSTFPVGTTDVTYRATDVSGNSVDHTFTILVNDTEAPVANCPPNLELNTQGTCERVATFNASVSDNCPGSSVALFSGLPSGSSFPVGISNVSFRATDAAGNTNDCSFTVTIIDVEDPVITCPQNIIVNSTLPNCGAPVTYTAPVGTDNCTPTTFIGTVGFESGANFPAGTTTVQYVVTDDAGNSASCEFDVTVNPIPNGELDITAFPVCQGDSTPVTFTFTSGTGPFNVTITDGLNQFDITGVSSGDTYNVAPPTNVTYSYVSIQDQSGCTRTSDFDGDAQVQVIAIPNIITTELDDNYCEDDAVVSLTANPSNGFWFMSDGAGGFLPGSGVINLGGGNAQFDPSGAAIGQNIVAYAITVPNSFCVDTAYQTVNVDALPTADAGSGGSECDLDFTFSAVASLGTGTWTLENGPGTVFFSDVNDPQSSIQVSTTGTYVFRWTEVNGECSDFDEVTVVFNEVPVANAGFAGAECDLDFPLIAVPSVGTGTWTASGPGGATYSPSANDASATATVDAYGTYTFTWTEDNNGCIDSDDIQVVFDELPMANAGTGGDQCDLDFTFNGTASVGTGTWTFTGPGGATFTDANSPTTDVTVTNYGTYEFTWTEVNGNCSSVDQVTVNFFEQPVADAGLSTDQCDLDFAFSANPSVGNGSWTQLNGPGTSVFADDTDPATTVTVDAYGTYTYTWTETNGTCTDSDNLVVNYYEQPTADAGQGGDECDLDFLLQGVASAGNGLWTATGPGLMTFDDDINDTTLVTVDTYGTYEFTWTELSGTCTDDASVTVNFYEQPVADAGQGGDECDLDFLTSATPSVGVGQWTQTAGPGTAAFTNANSAITTITVDAYGTYDFTWTETNGTCVDSRSITVNFYEQPAAEAGLGGNECDLDFILSANASVGNGVWTYSGPGTATFTDDADPNTTVTVSQSGAYTYTWTETNGTCSDSDDVVVNLFDQSVADAGSGGDECGLSFTFSAVPSFGTGTWTASGPGAAAFTDVNSATSTVTVDTYGTYTFTWTEVNGTCSDEASITVNFHEQPVANAGAVLDQCDLDYTFTGTASVGSGEWTFTGPGNVSANPSLNDVNATVTVDASGVYDFTWTEDNNGCVDSDDITVVFNSLPVVSFSGLDATYCIDQSTPVPLTGSPAGGTFSGLGISGNTFVPSVAGVGTILITYTYTDANGCTDSETQTVDVNGLPTVSFSGLDAEYCEDDATAYTLVGSPAGGTFAGSGITGDDFIPADATNGTHTITYEYQDAFGCSSSDEQTVVVNDLPTVSFTGLATTYCEDASNVSLTGSPAGGSFSGPGIIGSAFSPAAAGVGTHTISYSYTDANGCSGIATQQVTVADLPLPAITPSGTLEICDGETLSLDAGAGFAQYSWSPSGAGQIISVNSSGTYSVTVTTFEGCVGTSADVNVVVNPLPVVDLGVDTTICTGSVYEIDAENPGSSYSWSTFEITQTIEVTTTGLYEVDVTDQNGCIGSDAVAVTVSDILDPVIVANGPVTFCAGESVVLDAGPGEDYIWSTGETTQTISVSTSGIVDVLVLDEFGCGGTDEETITVLQLPNAVVQPSGPIELCSSDTVTLSASNAFAGYNWNPGGQATSAIDVWETGSYSVTVTDPNNGCVATSAPVEVIVNSTAAPFIVASGETEFCAGESVALSVEPGPYTSYLWTSGSTTPSIVVTETGSYGVTVVDANGCTDSTLVGNPFDVTVWDPNPVAVQEGDSIILSNGPFDDYQWFFAGGPIPGETAPVVYPSQNGIYTVEVVDENGCVGTSNLVEFTATSIRDADSQASLNLYPNPNSGEFTLELEFEVPTDVELSIVDVSGRMLFNPEGLKSVVSLRRDFDLGNEAAGVYYLRLVTNKNVITKQVIVR